MVAPDLGDRRSVARGPGFIRPGITRPRVTLAGGDGASGMATMLAELLEQNLRDFPARARVAGRARGDVVLTASDRDLSVTLSFGPGEVVVRDGARRGAPVLRGPWAEMTRLCSGQASPIAALLGRRVQLVPGRGMIAVPAASFALSVPASFYGDRSRQRRQLVVAGVVVLAAAGLVVAVGRGRDRPAL